jgi:hypothetical protein
MSDDIIESTAEAIVDNVPAELTDENPVEVEDAGQPEGEEVPEPKAEKDPWYKRRIDELTRDKHEARRQAERLEKVLEQQEHLLRQFSQNNAPQAVQGPVAPNADDYVGGEFDPRYMRDMMAYTRESAKMEAIEAVKQEQQETMQRQALAEQQRKLETAEAAARARYSDYDGVIEQITSDPMLAQNQTIRQALLGLDNGPEIAYTLGKNLDVAYEIANMHPIQAGMRLAEIINRAPRKISNTPTPIKPISVVGNTPGNAKDYSQMSTEEYIAARNAEDMAARQARYKR